MTDIEALEAFVRREELDQPTVGRLLHARLIIAKEVTNRSAPLGQREYAPVALTRRGRRLLESSKKKQLELKHKKAVAALKQIGSRLRRVRVPAGVIVAAVGLVLTYKYTGAEELRTKVYSPLNAELQTIDDYLQVTSPIKPFTSTAFTSLKQNGYFYRIPAPLQREITDFYTDAGQLQMYVSNVTDLLERRLSVEIEAMRSEQEDRVWRQQASARLSAEDAKQPGISASRSFAFNHAGRGRVMDVRDPNNPKIAGPGGPTWQIYDWLQYPESLEKVDPIFGDDDYLYFDDTRDLWYYRITRQDLEQRKITLKEFLQPIYDDLKVNKDFNSIAEQQPKLLKRLAHLKAQIVARMDDPKRVIDWFQ